MARKSTVKIEFNETNHTYKIGDTVLPSVTHILSESGLVDYSHIPRWIMNNAMNRGTNVHKACELINTNSLDWTSVPTGLIGYLHAYKKFILEYNYSFKKCEFITGSIQLGYACRIDSLGSSSIGNTIVEIKTGALKPWTAIQLIAQKKANGENSVKRIGLELKENGGYSVEIYEKDKEDWDTFKACQRIFQWKLLNDSLKKRLVRKRLKRRIK